MNLILDVLYVSLHNKSRSVAVFRSVCIRTLNNQSKFSCDSLQLTIEKSELSLEISWLVSVHGKLSFESSGGVEQ